MKVLLSLNAILLFFFFSLEKPAKLHEDHPDEVLNTLTRICNFQFNTGSTGSPCGSNEIRLYVNQDCEAVAEATLMAVNLHDNPIIGNQYPLLPGMPDIYYEYTNPIGATQVLGPIDSLTFNGEYFNLPNGGGSLPLFEYSGFMVFDVSNECENNNVSVAFDLVITITDINGSLYPIDSFANSGDAFQCDVFAETCDWCDPTPPSCTGGSDPIYYLSACGYCGSCDPGVVVDNKRSEEGDDDINERISDIQVEPNPFSDIVSIDYYLSASSKVRLELIDIGGAILRSVEIDQAEGANNLKLKTESLEAGIYLCRLQTNNQVQVLKIIKLN